MKQEGEHFTLRIVEAGCPIKTAQPGQPVQNLWRIPILLLSDRRERGAVYQQRESGAVYHLYAGRTAALSPPLPTGKCAVWLAATDRPQNCAMEEYRGEYEWYLERLDGLFSAQSLKFTLLPLST